MSKSLNLSRIFCPLSKKALRLCVFVPLFFGCTTTSSTSPGQGSYLNTQEFQLDSEKGALWMPATWTVSITDGSDPMLGDSLAQLRLRSISLTLEQSGTKKELQIPFTGFSKDAGSSVALTFDKPSRTLHTPRVFELSPGNYTLSGITATFIDEVTERPQLLRLPIQNPLIEGGKQPTQQQALQFKIEKAQVSAVGRLAFATTFGLKGGRLTSEMRREKLETDRIYIGTILEQLNWEMNQATKIIRANPDVPDFRYGILVTQAAELPKRSIKPMSVPVAIEAGLPCSFSGAIKMVWKKDTSPEEFVAILSSGEYQSNSSKQLGDPPGRKHTLEKKGTENCKGNSKVVRGILNLPKANWLLTATQIAQQSSVAYKSQISALQNPSQEIKSYYGNVSVGDLLRTDVSNEQQLRRRFYLPLKQVGADSQKLHYLGRFEITKNMEKSSSGKTAWNFLLKREFVLDALKTSFQSSDIYNPYSGQKIESPQKTGKVDSLFQLSATMKDTKKLGPYAAKIRKALTEAFAGCVQAQEEANPLLITSGNLKFTVRKGQRSGTVSSWKLDSSSKKKDQLRTCFRGAFDTFRFTNKSPASFDAEMTFRAQ